MTDIQQLSDIIRRRRSIFPAMYTGEKIDDEQILTMLENANWAPNHRKTEPWRFIVYSDEALESLGAYLSEKYKELTPEDKFSELKYKKTKKKVLASSHVIALCMHRDPEERLPEWEELAALSCAVQNMWLSCTAMGLGCYWSSPKTILLANEFLNLKAGEKCYGLMYLGVPQEGIELNSDRTDIKSKTKWIRN